MAKPSGFELQLLEKILRAKIHLESLKRDHDDACPSEDPHFAGDCMCGATARNIMINRVLEDLKID